MKIKRTELGLIGVSKMTCLIKWIDVGIDAEVHDGDTPRLGAAAVRFDAKKLATEMGYDLDLFKVEDALAIAQLIAERVNCLVSWADEPWVVTRLSGDSALAITGPGTIDMDAWNYLVSQFEEVCQLYGNKSVRSEIGQTVESAMVDWFHAENNPPVKARSRSSRF